MEKAIVVRGNLSDPKHIVLAEPVTQIRGEVEVVLRELSTGQPKAPGDVFDVIAQLRPGARSKEEIDRQVAQERSSWERA